MPFWVISFQGFGSHICPRPSGLGFMAPMNFTACSSNHSGSSTRRPYGEVVSCRCPTVYRNVVAASRLMAAWHRYLERHGPSNTTALLNHGNYLVGAEFFRPSDHFNARVITAPEIRQFWALNIVFHLYLVRLPAWHSYQCLMAFFSRPAIMSGS
jgi:hypothetical protein